MEAELVLLPLLRETVTNIEDGGKWVIRRVVLLAALLRCGKQAGRYAEEAKTPGFF